MVTKFDELTAIEVVQCMQATVDWQMDAIEDLEDRVSELERKVGRPIRKHGQHSADGVPR